MLHASCSEFSILISFTSRHFNIDALVFKITEETKRVTSISMAGRFIDLSYK